METIHVAYAFDDNYAEMSCVSMASMLYNTKNPIHFHVIESRLSDKSKSILVSLKDKFPHGDWSFHSIEAFDKSMFVVFFHRFTEETYYRLLLPELLPHLEKIIYLDGDTVIERDIAEIWQIELNDNLAGAVPDVFQSKFLAHKELLGLDKDDMYFNAGILLFNLAKLRDFDLYKKASEVCPGLYKEGNKSSIGWYQDQDVLNHLLRKKCIMLPPKYNFQTCNSLPFDCDSIHLSDWREAFLSPVIVHYVSSDKPNRITKIQMSSPLWERYFVYKAMTPFADVSDNGRINRYHQLEEHAENALISNYVLYFEYKKHSLFMELANKLPSMLNGKKLALWGVNINIRHLIPVLSTRDIYADVIVDGRACNRKKAVFHYEVQNPEILQDKREEYFVLLCMVNEKPAAQVATILTEYGYKENEFSHVFAPLWAVINDVYDCESI